MTFGSLTISNNAPSRFGFGALAGISADLTALNIQKALICTDKGIIAAGALDKLLGHLAAAETVIFDGTPANPSESAARLATALFKSASCDGVIAFGGGSSLDLGKAVALLATHDGALVDYTTQNNGAARIGAVAPLIAIPTTAGTGSEFARACVLILDNGDKRIIASPNLIPKLAILDPDLTLGLPPLLTAATGMDAVTHCIEAVLSPVENPAAEAIGLAGLHRALGDGALMAAVANGNDRNARYVMLQVSTLGAMAFSKGLGAVHAMSHACGKDQSLHLHHGTLNAVLLPPVLRFNRAAAPDKYRAIALALGVSADTDLATYIETLNHALGLPAGLSSMGITSAMIPDLAAHAAVDMCSATNPVPLDSTGYEALFAVALR
jgi:4-hydroxybutyrate dehydrogenase